MKRLIFVLCGVAFTLVSAKADMVVRTKDQQVHRLPVQASDVVSIEFTSSNASSGSSTLPNSAPHESGKRWVDSSNPSHYFVRIKGTDPIQWKEYSDGNAMFTFIQKAEAMTFIRLYDASRKVTVQIYDDYFKWTNSKGGSGKVKGGWK